MKNNGNQQNNYSLMLNKNQNSIQNLKSIISIQIIFFSLILVRIDGIKKAQLKVHKLIKDLCTLKCINIIKNYIKC